MNERKLSAWVEAGLIDQGAATRIRAWEAEHSRPLALWAVIGIAVLSIGLGLISVVAANWEEIPVLVRLAVHFALLVAVAGWLWWRGGDEAHPWREEAVLFVFGALGLTFFGHLGQAYQTTSPLWQPLSAWLALFGPVYLLRGQGWPTAAALVGTLVVAVWDYATGLPTVEGAVLAFALPTALPVGLAVLGAAMRRRSPRLGFWRRIEELGFAYALGGASLIAIGAGVENFRRGGDAAELAQTLLIWALVGFVAAVAIWWLRSDRSGRSAAVMLAACGVVATVAYPLSGEQVVGALLFMALWATVAWMALAGQWRGVFQLAVAVLALRLIVLSFELADDLLSSGFGLILAGLIMLGITWLALKVMRTYAPPRSAEEDRP